MRGPVGQALFLDAPVDTSLYSLYLHQNYPLFCDDVDDCFDAIEALSGADAMRTDEDLVRLRFPPLLTHTLVSHRLVSERTRN